MTRDQLEQITLPRGIGWGHLGTLAISILSVVLWVYQLDGRIAAVEKGYISAIATHTQVDAEKMRLYDAKLSMLDSKHETLMRAIENINAKIDKLLERLSNGKTI